VGERKTKAAVLGKPIAHSLSPVVHRAGYAAVGLSDWEYSVIECAEAELAGVVSALGPEWVGLSLTMPLKEAALDVAGEVSPLAAAIGAANTLVRRGSTWYADNTDAPGIVDALRWAELSTVDTVAVLGAGGTARAVLAAAADLGASVTLYARRADAIDELRPVAARLGIRANAADWSAAAHCGKADVVISTVPAGVADELAPAVAWRHDGVLLDAVYDPWPTRLAAAARGHGCRVVSGLDLLLAQAVRQFLLFTGEPAPVDAMRRALLAAAARRENGRSDRG
jgi:shikimate dehydrogenase